MLMQERNEIEQNPALLLSEGGLSSNKSRVCSSGALQMDGHCPHGKRVWFCSFGRRRGKGGQRGSDGCGHFRQPHVHNGRAADFLPDKCAGECRCQAFGHGRYEQRKKQENFSFYKKKFSCHYNGLKNEDFCQSFQFFVNRFLSIFFCQLFLSIDKSLHSV